MTCFLNYIGLQYCEGETVPASGLYLTSLPGISIEGIQKIANAEQATYLGVWDDVQAFALAKFRMDILNEINQCFELKRDCDFDTLICNNQTYLALAWQYLLGVCLMIFRINSDRINRWTTITRDQAKELRDLYQVEYEKALHQGVLLLDTEVCCLECGGNPNVVTWLP